MCKLIKTDFPFRFWPFKSADAFAPYPGVIVIKPSFANDLALIEHEKTHHRQQIEYGYWWWMLRYIFDERFRDEQEREANEVQRSFSSTSFADVRNMV